MHYRNIRVGSFKITAVEEIPETWVRDLINRIVSSNIQKINVIRLPPNFSEEKAIAKIYQVRKRKKILSRLKKSRAIREGEGYRHFNALGIKTLELIVYGEERKCGLFQKGLVVTIYKPVDTLSEAYRKGKDFELLLNAAEMLALIHKTGVAHGDPRTRNFLATTPIPLPFDLPSWSKLKTKSHMQDLVRFLGSAAVLLEDPKKSQKLLHAYRRLVPNLPAKEESILHAAEQFGIKKGEP